MSSGVMQTEAIWKMQAVCNYIKNLTLGCGLEELVVFSD